LFGANSNHLNAAEQGGPPEVLWDHPLGIELYDHTAEDTVENVAESVNLAADPAHAQTVAELHKQLVAGWRAAIPQ
jgi:hypothetical protein